MGPPEASLGHTEATSAREGDDDKRHKHGDQSEDDGDNAHERPSSLTGRGVDWGPGGPGWIVGRRWRRRRTC